MSTVPVASRITELRRAVRQARDDAFLVEPRVVRRIIRELHGYARLSTRIPHTEVLVARDESIKALAHPDELGLDSFDALPPLSILVAQPEEYEIEKNTVQDLLQVLWMRLFHGCIDLRMQQFVDEGRLTRQIVHDRIDQLGQVEFDEAHAVLISEQRLVNPESHLETFCEFVAVYLQLATFSPDMLPIWFPSLDDTSYVGPIIEEFVDGDQLFDDCHLYGATEPDLTSGTVRDEQSLARERESWTLEISTAPSAGKYARLMKRHERWSERGNTVAAAVLAVRAAEAATSNEQRAAAMQLAQTDIVALATRLRNALNFHEDDLDDWQKSLGELLENSVRGFWNSDKRLLYDLQKVCLDHERTIYRVDLVKWIVSRGRRPLRRPLTNVREVMMAKHLASSAARLVFVRLSGEERERLSRLLHEAAALAEQQMRERMRKSVHNTIMDVGLKPQSVPEKVAFDKMVEESLDCITERGYLTMGYLRDALSRNDLKLPDLTDPKDLIRGDHLLRTDDRLDVSLDGVYRRGEFYLRWLQVISSLAFGTRVGRFATLFMAIPFGGAVVIVVGLEHMLAVITGAQHKANQEAREAASAAIASAEGGEETLGTEDDAAAEESSDAADSPETATDVAVSDGPDVTETTGTETTDRVESADGGEATNSAATNVDGMVAVDATMTIDETTQTIEVPPHYLRPVYEFARHETIPLSITVGFLLMGLIHLPAFRAVFFSTVRQLWKGFRRLVYDLPLRILNLPAIQQVWRSRLFVRLRRYVINPLLGVAILGWLLPVALGAVPLDLRLIAAISLLVSLLINSRLGRDAEELTAEWLANAWHDLRSRFLIALLDWTIDFFKWLLNLLERFIYAVDEWLRFHSGETWLSVVAKAVLGVVWSFVSFLIRIYVNLLIEPTLHPVKHFPVVTVAHKIFLPVILVIEHQMRSTLTPYLGLALAGPITWFNIVFLPGIFGFLVWELKENWRLYESNRVPQLQPVIIGSHGETGGRMLKPGFHSGTLPKLFRQLRRIETKTVSFQRFSQRRALRERLEHSERDIRRFVERDLIRLLSYCPVWEGKPLACPRVHAASNSFLVELTCDEVLVTPLYLLFQEQSGWLVATISQHGWLDSATAEMQHSFEAALRGFYAKASVELVREQLERQLIAGHPYDIRSIGLLIWPERRFDEEIIVDLHRRHQVRPVPSTKAAQYGLQPLSRDTVVFAEAETLWSEWKQIWAVPSDSESSNPLPLACVQSARAALIGRR
ncbi:MAG: hypothetical protein R3C59_11940 [Planctomycetaceae bacterium]